MDCRGLHYWNYAYSLPPLSLILLQVEGELHEMMNVLIFISKVLLSIRSLNVQLRRMSRNITNENESGAAHAWE